jgi:hypothetical protein
MSELYFLMRQYVAILIVVDHQPEFEQPVTLIGMLEYFFRHPEKVIPFLWSLICAFFKGDLP